MTAYRKKLIEVALPLDAINRASEAEKRHTYRGHPATLHLWWARRPLASCRAVIFSSLVDDPDEPRAPKKYLEALDRLEKPPSGADGRREKLFYFIGRLVMWESTTDETILATARELIQLSCEGNPPPVLDPFCGGGSIPLEAQRLGLQAYASDLNPVAVLITKALIEIPPKFAGRSPVNPEDRTKMGTEAMWKGAAGLAADVRYYGEWMRDRAWERIGHLYPKGPSGETVMAWLWARTVTCPNPACGARMPLVRSFWLSTKGSREAWVEPTVVQKSKTVEFAVRTGKPANTDAVANGTGFVGDHGKKVQATFACVLCGGIAKGDYIDKVASAAGLGRQPLAQVAEGKTGRSHLRFPESVATSMDDAVSVYFNDEQFVAKLPKQECRGTFASNAQGRRYGFRTFSDYFTPRQLVALTTFSDLVGEAREQLLADTDGDTNYADAVVTYLAFVVDRAADYWSTLCTWHSGNSQIRATFARQALPMTWDFAEANPFSDSSGGWAGLHKYTQESLTKLPVFAPLGSVGQLDAATALLSVEQPMVATDPPYYDNIGYADLADYFYVWLRRALSRIYPDLFATLLTPKTPELIATPYRHDGSRKRAEEHFESGLKRAFRILEQAANPAYPFTLYYAFKQAESTSGSQSDALVSTGWQTMLHALIGQDLAIVGTWPVRTERFNRNIARDANALASSIVLVCRPRAMNAPIATFKQLQSEIGRELPEALSIMTGRDRVDGAQPWVDPIDLRQAAIGPGMAVYSRYSRVQKMDGTKLSVRDALIEINEGIDRYFDEMEGELDPDSRFCVQWYREAGFGKGDYGRAMTLAQAINVGVEAVEKKGLLEAKGGDVRLLKPDEYSDEVPIAISQWELCHRLIGALAEGEEAAARLYNRMPGLAEEARDLAYRLYLEAEKKGSSDDALGYNELVASWTDIRKRAAQLREETQASLI
jgi:putative DNA methylase